ncbi:hypothetical protein [Paracoccus sp. DMF]|uniref:hypothetical protein n=1 Tax=Paracoccus sp. DMF TaxID=400837 RepID=UPI0021E3ED03|nr:hypothetical protein [Paracoccus sp. DMF]MCV2448875.1 hypothetical protein [Paracoccus sp. DMF]
MTEARIERRHRNRRERRSRKQADHVMTGIIEAMGAGEVEDWQDEQEEGQDDEQG